MEWKEQIYNYDFYELGIELNTEAKPVAYLSIMQYIGEVELTNLKICSISERSKIKIQ